DRALDHLSIESRGFGPGVGGLDVQPPGIRDRVLRLRVVESKLGVVEAVVIRLARPIVRATNTFRPVIAAMNRRSGRVARVDVHLKVATGGAGPVELLGEARVRRKRASTLDPDDDDSGLARRKRLAAVRKRHIETAGI